MLPEIWDVWQDRRQRDGRFVFFDLDDNSGTEPEGEGSRKVIDRDPDECTGTMMRSGSGNQDVLAWGGEVGR